MTTKRSRSTIWSNVGLDTAQKQLGALAAAGRDLTPVMRDIGKYLLRSTKDRFN